MTMCVRVILLAAFGLFTLGASVAAQTAAPKTLVEVDGHKLNVRSIQQFVAELHALLE